MSENAESDASVDPTLLGTTQQGMPTSPEQATLETFANPHPERDYQVTFDCPEFTSLCPVTRQPDFATIRIEYVPDRTCLESKSLKIYLFSFRNLGCFGEGIVNRILDDLVACCQPRRAKVIGHFTARGGIALTVIAQHPDPSLPS